jgi:hypothetical protein
MKVPFVRPGGPPISSLATDTDKIGPATPQWQKVHPPNPSESPIDASQGVGIVALVLVAAAGGHRSDDPVRDVTDVSTDPFETPSALKGPVRSSRMSRFRPSRQGRLRGSDAQRPLRSVLTASKSGNAMRQRLRQPRPGGPPVSTLPAATDSSASRKPVIHNLIGCTPSESPIRAAGGPPVSILLAGTDGNGVSDRMNGPFASTLPQSGMWAASGPPESGVPAGTDRNRTSDRMNGPFASTVPQSGMWAASGPPKSSVTADTDRNRVSVCADGPFVRGGCFAAVLGGVV